MNFKRLTFPRLLMLAALALGLMPPLAFAQSVTQVVPAYQSKIGMTAATSPLCIDLTQSAVNDHTFVYSTTRTTSTVLVTITGSTDSNAFTSVTTGSTTTAAPCTTKASVFCERATTRILSAVRPSPMRHWRA